MCVMCGRYSLQINKNFPSRFSVDNLPQYFKSQYNIAPSQTLPVIISQSGKNQIQMMKWGLIPPWSKDEKGGIINTRVESVSIKPVFKKLLKNNRCLVPATGFFEWKNTDNGKQPHYIHLKTNNYFSMAGLFDDKTQSYTIITTTPNKLLETIHQRMPVIFSQDQEKYWLENNIQVDKIDPFPEELMEAYPVSWRVNSPVNNDQLTINRI